jgi:hypothetical protein
MNCRRKLEKTIFSSLEHNEYAPKDAIMIITNSINLKRESEDVLCSSGIKGAYPLCDWIRAIYDRSPC